MVDTADIMWDHIIIIVQYTLLIYVGRDTKTSCYKIGN